MAHRPFSELVAKMSPKAQERSREMADEILAKMELSELREALKIRQEDIAKTLKTTQAAISRLEARPDTKVSTLERYIHALGGNLEIRAVLPDRTIQLTHVALAGKFTDADLAGAANRNVTIHRRAKKRRAMAELVISRRAHAASKSRKQKEKDPAVAHA